MAIADVIGRVYSALLLQGVSNATPFAGLAQDRSAEIVDGGNGLRVPLGMDAVTIRPYVKGTDIVLSDANPTHADLDLNIQKYFAAGIDDVDEAQTRFSLLADSASTGSRSLAVSLSADFRAVIHGANYAGMRNHVAPAAADVLTDAEIVGLHSALLDVVGELRGEGYTSSPYVILPRAMWKQLSLYYSTRPHTLPASSPESGVFRDAVLSGIYGADVQVDYNDGFGADRPFNIYAGISQRTLTWARQITNTERMRSQTQFATVLRGLVTYGIGVQDIDSAHRIEVKAGA